MSNIAVAPQKMATIRRHRITEADLHRVITHLKLHGKITKNDRITRPLKKGKKKKGGKVVFDEEIPWSQGTELMGSWQSKDLKAGPKGALVLYAKENGTWKRIVPEEQIETFMRAELLNPESKMPLSRDNSHYHLMKSTVGISRRAAYKFLEKQSVLQLTKNIPNERVKGGIKLYGRGYCEMDLIEGKGRDLYKHVGASGNWYWLSVVELLTGYGMVEMLRSKNPTEVAEALKDLVPALEKKLKAKVHTIATDHGREFYTKVRAYLKSRKIKQKQVQRGSRVEQFNQVFQRNFYRILRLGRGSFSSLQDQAQEITNRLRNKHTKVTPEEALGTPDEKLSEGYNAGREDEKDYKGPTPKVGDKARVLIKMRKNIRPILKIGSQSRLFKTYHGRHFTKKVHKITRVTKRKLKEGEEVGGAQRYFINAAWHDVDELLLVSGVDAETDRQIEARKK